ncbi:MAG: HTTM domain-containing protein [Chitinophagales bacterium]
MKPIKFDISSIRLFRIFFGIYILFEICWTFCLNFKQLFESEEGVWGRFFIEKYIDAYFPNNLLFYLITTNFQYKLFIGILISLVIIYILGYYPKIISLILTILLGALYAKYNILLAGWQQYMLCVLFLSSFIIENSEEQQAANWYENVLLFQIGFIYFFNAISKNGASWLNGNAIEQCFRYYPLTTDIGNYLLNFPGFLKILTYGSLLFEISLLFLLLFGYRYYKVRTFTSVCLVLFHLCIQITMEVGHFYLVVMCVAILIIPLDSIYTKLINLSNYFSVKRNSPVFTSNKYFHIFISFVFLYFIIMSNVYQNKQQQCKSEGSDFNETLVSRLYPSNINYVPFFSQYWHFFAPNPALKTGVIGYIGKKNDSSLHLIHNGNEIKYISYEGINKYLATYIALKDYNIKDKLFIQCALVNQFRCWNIKPENYKLISFSMYEFYQTRYIDRQKVESLMFDKTVHRSLKLNLDLKYKK